MLAWEPPGITTWNNALLMIITWHSRLAAIHFQVLVQFHFEQKRIGRYFSSYLCAFESRKRIELKYKHTDTRACENNLLLKSRYSRENSHCWMRESSNKPDFLLVSYTLGWLRLAIYTRRPCLDQRSWMWPVESSVIKAHFNSECIRFLFNWIIL